MTAEGTAGANARLQDIDKQIAELQAQQKRAGSSSGGMGSDGMSSPDDAKRARQASAQIDAQLRQLQNERGQLQKQVSGAIPISQLENMARGMQEQSLGQFQSMVQAGPGMQDVESALGAQRGLAATLEQFSQGGFLPTEQDFATAQQFTSQAFAPQQEQMNQLFQSQQTEAKRLAAQLGRPVNDPVIQAKLAQMQGQQQAMLGAQQTAFGSQFALSLPGQRLGFQEARTGVLQQLADRAQSNRQLAFSLGSAAQNLERDFRLKAGLQSSNQTTTTTQGANAFDIIGGALAAGGAVASGGASLGLWGAGRGAAGAAASGFNAAGGLGGNLSLGVNTNLGGGGVGLPGSPVSAFSSGMANQVGGLSSSLSTGPSTFQGSNAFQFSGLNSSGQLRNRSWRGE